MKNGLTREHSGILYGMAILCMLDLHVFCMTESIKDWYLVFGMPEVYIGWFGKICLMLYAFISGYGMDRSGGGKNYKTFWYVIKEDYRKVFRHLLGLYRKYWLVFFLFVPYGMFLGVRQFSAGEFFLNFIGMKCTYNGEWWYLRTYVGIMLLFPFLNYLFRSVLNTLSFLKVFLLITALGSIVALYFTSNAFHAAAHFLFKVVNPYIAVIFVLGYLTSYYKVYEKITTDSTFLQAAVFLGCAAIRMYASGTTGSMAVDPFLAVPLVWALANLLEKVRYVKRIMLFYGRLSVYMWLTHSFFLYYYHKDFILSSQVSTLIFLKLLLVSTAAGYILYYLDNKVLFQRIR